MLMTYRDAIGYVSVIVDEHGISFLDGYAYFSDNKKEYKVPVGNIVSVEKMEVK